VFDKNGRILVDSSGVFPCTVVTDFFIGEVRLSPTFWPRKSPTCIVNN
jgi:hypothetical protein